MSALPPVSGQAAIEQLLSGHAIAPGANPGLVFDRNLAIWKNPLDKSDDVRGDLETFVRGYNRLRTSDAHVRTLAIVHARLDTAGGTARTFRCDWRLATGLGAAHPLENGFTFDRITGTPMLSGSSVKGLCRATVDALGTDAQRARLDYLFGPTTGADTKHAGALTFLPAYPQSWPELAVDVVNCHHSTYYQGASKWPKETESPIPVYFLTVAPGTRFVFRLLSRSADPRQAADEVAEGFGLLTDGLGTLGIGAKTAVGYGLMTRTD